ncbi:histone-lysine N-methyltransferase ash1 [Bradysia coprophila]|uniref:histone-lysine N-methyltransferase ash1 n=1 Tax=Bradysia coprophila TaxID=38358 RepID=UPI00187DD5AC|nr:histone-lysine N-methyltransferase ash1 [Bradysia coprophila]
MNNKDEISNKTDSDSSDTSDSEEASESSSESSSSSSHDDSSKKKKVPQTQQFSVMRSDTGGLRMKISAVPATSTHSNNNNESSKHVNASNKNHKYHKKQSVGHKQKRRENDSSSSCCSECSDSGSDSSSATNNHTTKRSNKSSNFKRTTTSSDSDSSDDVDSDDGSRFSKINLTSGRPNVKANSKVNQATDAADGASSSDMELPALVSAAIQRVESFSDGENSKTDPIPQYTSTLLRDFMVKTQMMGSTFATAGSAASDKKENRQFDGSRWQNCSKDIKTESPQLSESVPPKRKRGRPKKQVPLVVNVGLATTTSESPDSGITSTPHSPVLTSVESGSKASHNQRNKPQPKKLESSTSMPKLNITSLEKSIYATERVLYPPRRKKRDVSVSSAPKPVLSEDLLDPVWRKIDINKKFRRPSVSGYKSDGGCSTVCSKVLVARCNNVSGDYGGVSQRSLSGYKSDYSCKSKRSGYKSDYSVKAKSCGYRTDSGMKNRKRVRKKRRLKSLCSKSPVNDLDILQLAGLSLGQSEDSSRDSLNRSSSNLLSKSNFRKKNKNTILERNTKANTSKDILSSLCERVTKRLSGMDETPPHNSSPTPNNRLSSSSVKNSTSRPGLITCRRMSTVSHCSSRSGGSRMHSRRKHRKRFKSRSRSETVDTNSTKLNMQIEMLTNSFTTLCHINDKSSKTDNSKSKRVVKKRKQSVNSDAANASTTATTSKRRHKKVPQTQSPDDHKLPLKKRLYLLTPGEKLDGKQSAGDSDSLPATSAAHKSSTNTHHAKITTKAITPKKRHLLENQQNATVSSPKSVNSPKHIDFTSTDSTASIVPNVPQKTHHQSRKRSKQEATGTKNQSSNEPTIPKLSNASTRPSVIRPSSTSLPPPGVFESTIDLEVQIPAIPAIITKTEIDSPRTFGEAIAKIVKDEPNSKAERFVETLLNKTGGHLLLRKKRKKANRTGFPTVRKKKKKVDDWSNTETKPTAVQMEVDSVQSTSISADQNSATDDCDRVPKSGETAATFIERNSRPRLSVVSLERLQGKVSNDEEMSAADAVGDAKQSADESNDATVGVKRRRSEVIGRVKQHLKKNIREPRDLSSDNEPLINLISAKKSNNSKSTAKENETKTVPPTNSAENVPTSSRYRRVVSLDKLGADQIKEIERTSKLAIVKLEVLKSDKASISRTRSRSARKLPEPVVKEAEKSKTIDKRKGIKILTARETLLGEQPLADNTLEVAKMTRRLTRDMSAELAKRTRQAANITQNVKVVENCHLREQPKAGEKSKILDKSKATDISKHADKSKVVAGKKTTQSKVLSDPTLADNPKAAKSSKVSTDNSKVVANAIVEDVVKGDAKVTEKSKVNDVNVKDTGKANKSQIGDKVLLIGEPATATTNQDNKPVCIAEKPGAAKKNAKAKDKTTSTLKPLKVSNKNEAATKTDKDSVSTVAPDDNGSKDQDEGPPNLDLEELLVDVTTKISKTGTTEAHGKSKSSKPSASKKATQIEPRKSIDSKSNYQSEFEKSLTDVLAKNVTSKENVDQPVVSPTKPSEHVKTPDSEAPKTIAKPTKGRKRKLSVSSPKEKDSECAVSDSAVKKQKVTSSDAKAEEQVKVANASRKSGSKKRNAKITDKPLTELQPQVIDSMNQNKSIVRKTDAPEAVATNKKSRKVIKQDKVDLLDEEAVTFGDDCDESNVRPFDPLVDLEHDPLPCDEGPKIVEPLSDSDSSKKVTKPKKKYLVAGLFSDYYKRSPKANDKSAARVKETVPEDHRVTLPIPPYCEKYFRRTIQDFELPYDLWYAHQNEKLPGRNSVPSWNFKKLRTNIYGDVRANPSTDQQPCSCKPETACGDDCLNRLMYTECSPKTCPCGDKCQNTKIQRHIVAPGVERFMTQNKGWGVRTKQLLKKSTYLLEYVGEVVTEREFKERMATLYTRDTHHYCLNLDGGLVIDGHRSGSDARFVNHSCSPNCEIQKWSVNGLFRMALFTMRDIQPGEELTYDYNFSLFNPAEGQPCRCETPQCRGVIGGKSQRIKPIEPQVGPNSKSSNNKGKTGRPRKNKANKNQSFMHHKDRLHIAFVHPTSKELLHIKNGNCFLMRNMRKYRQKKVPVSTTAPATLTAQISALRAPRNIRTRGLTIAEHDPTIEKTARIAGILREICEEIGNYKDKGGQYLVTKLNPPTKKKCPEYYEKVEKPIDLSTIESNVEKGHYKLPGSFDEDVLRLFSNVVKFYGLTSPEGLAAQELLGFYTTKKENVYQRLLTIIGDSQLIKSFVPDKPNQLLLNVDPNEDIIQCICGLFRDEGVMIQCAKCLVWQHTECTGADVNAESYLCERCDNRTVDLEIPLNEYTDEGYRYYLTLMRGDLQVHQTDTVYVLRDIPMTPDPDSTDSTSPPKKHTYKTIGKIEYTECDIFRVERLWKDDDGNRFVFGHHYLRPHETYHEPSRKFYQNEVVRVPLYEKVPIDLVMGRCWVLDPTTFCKGRPVDCEESHVYICELRMDKAARLFSKISKQQYPVCTKSYAFNKFEQKLKISRNYLPHHIANATLPKPKKKKNEEQTTARKNSTPIVQLMPIPSKTLNEKRTRLENHLSKLMTKMTSLNEDVQPINLSYLLTGRGARRRANVTTNVPT